MENAELKTVYQKLLSLSDEKQAEAAEILTEYIANDQYEWPRDSLLTPEQQAIVIHRIANPDPNPIPHQQFVEQMREHIAKRQAELE